MHQPALQEGCLQSIVAQHGIGEAGRHDHERAGSGLRGEDGWLPKDYRNRVEERQGRD